MKSIASPHDSGSSERQNTWIHIPMLPEILREVHPIKLRLVGRRDGLLPLGGQERLPTGF
jgi:hypothetical protein